MPLPIVRLTCHAPHPDPARKGEACGGLLGDVPGALDFVTTVRKLPTAADGLVSLRCPKNSCGAWNRFRLTPLEGGAEPEPTPAPVPAVLQPTDVGTPAPPDPATRLPTLDEVTAALATLEPRQVRAIALRMGGLARAQAARELGLSAKTLQRWEKDDRYCRVLELVIVSAAGRAVEDMQAPERAALSALMDVIERDRKKGVAHNARWLLARTRFRDLELQKALAGGTAVNVNVQQQQQQVQGSITAIWEQRRGDGH